MTVYNKGGELIRMLRLLLGQAGFRRGMDLYFARHDGQAVRVEDFIAAMEAANNWEAAPFMGWYQQAGTPVVEVQEQWSPEKKEFRLLLKQGPKALLIPLLTALYNSQGHALPLTLRKEKGAPCERLLLLEEETQEFVFQNISEKPILSLLRGFSAPVKLRKKTTDEELAFLFARDQDPFNRWEAGQKLITGKLLEQLYGSGELTLDPRLPQAWRQILEEDQADPAWVALALQVPSPGMLAEEVQPILVEGICQVREFFKHELAIQLKPWFAQSYARMQDPAAYQFEATQVGKRALKNLALAYLAEAGELALALEQFLQASNMTDQLGALSALIDHPGPERDQALKEFERQWEKEPLVMNHWFSLQAGSRGMDADKIQNLMKHVAYDPQNPNKLRSLLGVFSNRNFKGFHQAEGQGYALLRTQIESIDPKNPQMAARLVQPLIHFRKFEGPRQELMQKELKTLFALPGISKNLYEIVAKGLGQEK